VGPWASIILGWLEADRLCRASSVTPLGGVETPADEYGATVAESDGVSVRGRGELRGGQRLGPGDGPADGPGREAE
jgi:hypothetical protein